MSNLASLKPLTLTINGQTITAEARQFSTGSLGYFLSGKIQVELADGTIAKLQVGCNAVLVGSNPNKPAKKPRESANPSWDRAQAALKAQAAASPTPAAAPVRTVVKGK